MEHSDDNESKTQYFSTTEYSGGEMFGYTAATPVEPKAPSKRPLIISVICVLGFIAGAIGLILSLVVDYAFQPDWMQPFVITGVLVTATGYIGIWNMKLWGLYLLVLMFIVSMAVGYSTGQYSVVSMGGSGIILLICVLNSGKMD